MRWRKISRNSIANQQHLQNCLNDLFPGTDIHVNAKKGGGITSTWTGHFLELDIYLPSLKLAFEYQDPHHYTSYWYSYTPPASVKMHDDKKMTEMHQRGETLIVIPCWWEGDEKSLVATILHYRPELARVFPATLGRTDVDLSSIIPHTPPDDYFNKSWIPDVGELMLAAFPYASMSYNNWWTSEKYDGVRACWNPRTKKMYNRYAVEIEVPFFSRLFGNAIRLDGEIWFGRGSFDEATKVTHSANGYGNNFDWTWLRYCVFDSPVDTLPYEHRFRLLCERISVNPVVEVVPQWRYCGSSAVDPTSGDATFRLITNAGGEGLVLRLPGSPYVHGRSLSLLKLKEQRDQEGLVVASDTEGAYQIQVETGRVLAKLSPTLMAEHSTTNGTALRIGEVVTIVYKRFDTDSDTPMDATIVRRRSDVEWFDVQKHAVRTTNDLPYTKQQQQHDLYTKQQQSFFTARYEYGHWSKEGSMRQYFDAYAAKKGIDPLIPSSWYSVLRRDVMDQMKSAGAMSRRPFIEVLIESYPDIGLNPHAFLQKRRYWDNVANRKRFFDQIALDKGFDPLDPVSWYDLDVREVYSRRAGYFIMDRYRESLPTALADVYPNVKFSLFRFTKLKSSRFLAGLLVEMAATRGFDPLVADNWRTLARTDRANISKRSSVFRRHRFMNLVRKAFPDIALSEYSAPK